MPPVKAAVVNAEVELYKLVKTFQTSRSYLSPPRKAFDLNLVFEIVKNLLVCLHIINGDSAFFYVLIRTDRNKVVGVPLDID